MAESFSETMTRHMARHSHPFVFQSRIIGTDHTEQEPDTFAGQVLFALSRRNRVFRQHRHRRAALVVHMEKASLHMYDLGGKNLAGFSMRRADLVRAHLVESNLANANLFRAKLEGADLTGAVLTRADLRECDLRAAVLFRADLSGALLQGAALGYADLRGAVMRAADLSGADLRNARLDGDFDRSEVVSDEHTRWPDDPEPTT